MKSKIVFIILTICLLACISACKSSSDNNNLETDWNHGYCIDCNTKLEYSGCGNKYHYTCPSCKKVYTFDSAQNYNE
jgi:hypothetical protein